MSTSNPAEKNQLQLPVPVTKTRSKSKERSGAFDSAPAVTQPAAGADGASPTGASAGLTQSSKPLKPGGGDAGLEMDGAVPTDPSDPNSSLNSELAAMEADHAKIAHYTNSHPIQSYQNERGVQQDNENDSPEVPGETKVAMGKQRSKSKERTD